MTEQPEKSNVDDSQTMQHRYELSVMHSVRVELMPRPRVIDVSPFCGPEADLVRVNWYELERDHFLTSGEAMALANAIRKAAVATANPPKWRTSGDG